MDEDETKHMADWKKLEKELEVPQIGATMKEEGFRTFRLERVKKLIEKMEANA